MNKKSEEKPKEITGEEVLNELLNRLDAWLIVNTGDSLKDRIPELYDEVEDDAND